MNTIGNVCKVGVCCKGNKNRNCFLQRKRQLRQVAQANVKGVGGHQNKNGSVKGEWVRPGSFLQSWPSSGWCDEWNQEKLQKWEACGSDQTCLTGHLVYPFVSGMYSILCHSIQRWTLLRAPPPPPSQNSSFSCCALSCQLPKDNFICISSTLSHSFNKCHLVVSTKAE